MALPDKTSVAKPVAATFAVLPSVYPELPEDVLKRFPTMQTWYDSVQRVHRRVNEALESIDTDLSAPIVAATASLQNITVRLDDEFASAITNLNAAVGLNGAVSTYILDLQAAVGDPSDPANPAGSLYARVTNEITARAGGDTALASDITTLTATVNTNYTTLDASITSEATTRADADTAISSTITTLTATVGTKAKIAVQGTAPSSPATNDLWIDTSDNNKAKYWDGAAWQYKQDGILAAAVSTEASARATADGFLEGKYTIKVIAGNVVTGMNITSSTGAGTDVSDITFQASSFKVYNGTAGVAPFQVVGGVVRVSALSIISSDVSGLAATATSSDFSAVTGATKPADNADVTLTAINGGLSVTGGGLILSSTAMIRAGQTNYHTGTGFFLGMHSGTPKLSLGNPSGNYLTWDGSSLTVNGSITLTNTIPAGSVSGLAATATSSDFASVTGATKPANNADVTLTAINGGLSVTGGGLILSSTAMIRAGQTDYNTGTGFFLGMHSGTPKFSIGNPSGNRLTWDGSTLAITGSITLTNTIAAGSVTGLAATATSSDYSSITGTKPPSNADVTLTAINGGLSVTGGGITLSSGGAIKGGASDFATGIGFFLGYESGQYKFRVGNPSGARIEWDGSTWTVVSWPVSASAAPQASLTNGGTAPYRITVNAPTGAPAGWYCEYSQGSGSLMVATSFPFTLTMASASEILTIVGRAPNYLDSSPAVESWNSLFL